MQVIRGQHIGCDLAGGGQKRVTCEEAVARPGVSAVSWSRFWLPLGIVRLLCGLCGPQGDSADAKALGKRL
jgi:hypothetical protein